MIISLDPVTNCPKGAKPHRTPNFQQLTVDGVDTGVVSQTRSWTGMAYVWTTRIWCHDGRYLKGVCKHGEFEGQEYSLLNALGLVEIP